MNSTSKDTNCVPRRVAFDRCNPGCVCFGSFPTMHQRNYLRNPFFFTCHKQKSFSFPGSLRVFKCKNLFKANILRLVRTHCVVMYSSVTLFVYYQVPFSLFFFPSAVHLCWDVFLSFTLHALPLTRSKQNLSHPKINLCKTYAVSEQRRRNQTQV